MLISYNVVCGCRGGKAVGLKGVGDGALHSDHPLHGTERMFGGANVKRVPQEIMHILLFSGCFDAAAIGYIKDMVSEMYDVEEMLQTLPPYPFPAEVPSPPDESGKQAATAADAAATAAAKQVAADKEENRKEARRVRDRARRKRVAEASNSAPKEAAPNPKDAAPAKEASYTRRPKAPTP